jgi:hypothetical protein
MHGGNEEKACLLVWGILAFLFVAGFTFYPGCGVGSGASTGKPAYAVPVAAAVAQLPAVI